MIYVEDGSRIPFDPLHLHQQLSGCMLCGAAVAAIGVFIPQTAEMRSAVLRLRTHTVPPNSTPSVAYGLCRQHAADLNEASAHVEAAIVSAAARVVVQ